MNWELVGLALGSFGAGFLFGAFLLAWGIRIGYMLSEGEKPDLLPGQLPTVREYQVQEETE